VFVKEDEERRNSENNIDDAGWKQGLQPQVFDR